MLGVLLSPSAKLAVILGSRKHRVLLSSDARFPRPGRSWDTPPHRSGLQEGGLAPAPQALRQGFCRLWETPSQTPVVWSAQKGNAWIARSERSPSVRGPRVGAKLCFPSLSWRRGERMELSGPESQRHRPLNSPGD